MPPSIRSPIPERCEPIAFCPSCVGLIRVREINGGTVHCLGCDLEFKFRVSDRMTAATAIARASYNCKLKI